MPSNRKDLSLADGQALACDVLVVGGGPAAAWAALSAAGNGANVVLVDKGYFGTSGATAPSNTGTWYLPPGDGRAAAVEARWKRTAGLADKRWMLRCVDQSFENLAKLVEWGYPFPNDDGGNLYVANLRGPDYMRFMRARVAAAGVRILDHHPILELVGDGHAVKGAQGMTRRTGASFRVDAGAVVLATGGCAFFERILGGTGLTGDGHLFAAEAGASLSGMEFTGKYTLAPKGTSLNKGLPFRWATFYRPDGTPLQGPDGERLTNGIGPAERIIARALAEDDVLARLDLADASIQDALRRGQPNCFAPYDKMGIDPFSEMFPVELKFEGTIRGTGGIRIASSECGTEIPGLYVAGDAASRENVTGGFSGGGAINSSWAMASGWWAGRDASSHAKRKRNRPETASAPLGRTGLRAQDEAAHLDLDQAIRTVRAEIAPLGRNYHRTAGTLTAGREVVEGVWRRLEAHLQATGRDRLRAREVAAVTAATRWTLAAAELRTESRGVHRRSDHPAEKDSMRRRIAVSGVRSVHASWEADADTIGFMEGSAS